MSIGSRSSRFGWCWQWAIWVCLAGLFVLTAPPSASACLNAVELSRKRANRVASEAEKALAAGDPQRARNLLIAVFGSREPLEFPSPAVQRKLTQLYAIACMRVGNAKSVAHAVDVLREQSKSEPKNPLLKVRLAEALLHQAPASKEALVILEPLEKQDLIVDAEGYATLARLRKASGDSHGANLALSRCRAMAKQESICSDAPLAQTSTLDCPLTALAQVDWML